MLSESAIMSFMFTRRRRSTAIRVGILLFCAVVFLLAFHRKPEPSSIVYQSLKNGEGVPFKRSDKQRLIFDSEPLPLHKPIDLHSLKVPKLLDVDDPKEHDFFANMKSHWGENGEAVVLRGQEIVDADKLFSQAAFNVYISDRMPLNRTLPDVRHEKCSRVPYPDDLPTTSVIIIYTNEIFSALLRTIVSVINRTPRHLLKEIILVDDFSDKADLKERLDSFIARHFAGGFIKLIRLSRRSGLIQARLTGAKAASGDVLLFLDSHCETTDGWLEPLLWPIKKDRTTVVCPVIDIIDDKSFQYQSAPADFFQVGGFNWRGEFTWHDIPPEVKRNRSSIIEPVETPTMAGGLFAIDRKYFWESGSYDDTMNGWGGENLEMSFRIWQCGGRILIAPCSHVGHIFRDYHPYKFPQNLDTHSINTVRLAEVWMDDYKFYLYQMRPDLKTVDAGDLTARRKFRQKHNCKSFKWFLKNVYPQKFVPAEHSQAYGYLKNPLSNICLDTMGRQFDQVESAGLFPCHRNAEDDDSASQTFFWTNRNELRRDDNCAQVESFTDEDGNRQKRMVFARCYDNVPSKQIWIHRRGGVFMHRSSGYCLDAGRSEAKEILLRKCDRSHRQVWWFQHYNSPKAKVQTV